MVTVFCFFRQIKHRGEPELRTDCDTAIIGLKQQYTQELSKRTSKVVSAEETTRYEKLLNF